MRIQTLETAFHRCSEEVTYDKSLSAIHHTPESIFVHPNIFNMFGEIEPASLLNPWSQKSQVYFGKGLFFTT